MGPFEFKEEGRSGLDSVEATTTRGLPKVDLLQLGLLL